MHVLELMLMTYMRRIFSSFIFSSVVAIKVNFRISTAINMLSDFTAIDRMCFYLFLEPNESVRRIIFRNVQIATGTN